MPAAPLWTERTVAWYERANARSDYSARVLSAAAPALAGCRSALDIGAGFGALALPLARRLERVTAMEPAPAMAAALRRAAALAALDNVTVIKAAWGDAAVRAHDLVVCAHVGPLLGPGSTLLPALRGLARRAVVLVREAAGGDAKFFYPELYPRLLGRPYEARRACRDVQMLEALAAVGVTPTVTPIAYRSDQPFDSLEEACDFWMTYMGLEGEAPRAFLHRFLGERLQREGDAWVAPLRKRTVVVWWRVCALPWSSAPAGGDSRAGFRA